MSAYESIKQGLNEALVSAGGYASHARVHQVEVQAVDVAAIRGRRGLSQAAFARIMGGPSGLC
jgi:putative transcriptional regulator